jgi:hypothetical protein
MKTFGDTAADQNNQAKYLADHHILNNGDGTYTLQAGATDFNYFVQIGNKGTWSEAHVDVTAPEPVHVPTYQAGDALFVENFDDYNIDYDHGSWGDANLSSGIVGGPSAGHAWALSNGDGTWSGVYGEVVQGNAFPGSIAGTSTPDGNDHWLDTQNSPGGINIINWFHDPTGGAFQVSFDLGIHDFGDDHMTETQHNATLDVLVDGNVVKTISYDDVLAAAKGTDQMAHFEFAVTNAGDGIGDTGNHQIGFHDTTQQAEGGNYVGFALDSIHVNDWLLV